MSEKMTSRRVRNRSGRRVFPRRFGFCIHCEDDTVQWLWAVSVHSPGSYRGTRVHAKYVCQDCGRMNL